MKRIQLHSTAPPLDILLTTPGARLAAPPDYWATDAYYLLDARALERTLVPAARELWSMCLDLVERAVTSEEILQSLGIPQHAWRDIHASWRAADPSLLARFDLSFDGATPPKLHECNIDVTGLLFETTLFQRRWMDYQQRQRHSPARNSAPFIRLEEDLASMLMRLADDQGIQIASLDPDPYDVLWGDTIREILVTRGAACEVISYQSVSEFVAALERDAAASTRRLVVKDFRWDGVAQSTDLLSRVTGTSSRVLSPLWTQILSSKGCLPWLWSLNRGHPNLLEAHFRPQPFARSAGVVTKPLFSIQGRGVTLLDRCIETSEARDEARPGAERHIYQELCYLPRFPTADGARWASTGAWVVDGKVSAVSLTESPAPVITEHTIKFVPHISR